MNRRNRIGLTMLVVVLPGVAVGREPAKAVPCGPERIMLTYPVEASREYISGRLEATFDVGRNGRVRNVHLVGVRAFASEVRNALKKAEFGAECRGLRSTTSFSFLLDRKLPLASAVIVRRVSVSEYQVVSPTDLTGSLDVDPYMIDEGHPRLAARFKGWLGRLRFW